MARMNVTTPIGTLTANSQGQEPTARMAPAMLGPDADDTETTSDTMPIARPSWRRG
jgi:hypothetical protein